MLANQISALAGSQIQKGWGFSVCRNVFTYLLVTTHASIHRSSMSDEEKTEQSPAAVPAAGLTFDLNYRHGFYPFAVTLTSTDPSGFSKDQQKQIKAWHIDNTDQCLLSRELHGSGFPHYHSYVTVRNKQPAGLTRKLKTLYKTMNMDWSHNAVVVKTATDPAGWMGYCLKDLKSDERPLMLKGYKLSWIKDQAMQSMKQREHKRKGRSADDPFVLCSKNAVRLCLEFADKKGLPVSSQHTFALLCAAMMEDNYNFDRIRYEQLYCQLRCKQGNHTSAVSMIMGKLQFIDD